MNKLLLTSAFVMGLATCQMANAISFTLASSAATITPGNTTAAFYNVSGDGVESGTAASLYSATFGGDANNGFWVKVSFDSNPQPVLTSAFLKASNKYLWWDAADLAAFNAGTYDSIVLENTGAGGIKNQNGKYKNTSHAGLNGTKGTNVPDGGATAALLGLGLLGIGFVARRRA